MVEYPEGNCHLKWDCLIENYVPKSAPLSLALKEQFESSCLQCTSDDSDALNMELEDLCNQIDEIDIS